MKHIKKRENRRNLSLVNFLVLGGVLTLTSGFVIAFSGNYAWGQISSDGTVGSQVTSPIPGAFLIEGGATRGSNLFHSFTEFSVPSNGLAHFNNLTPIQNIISRVTGGSVSNIDGLISANGTVNLFFINPNGIVFGPNAKLSIGGSFLASTASSLNFADGSKFSATASQTTPLLTVSVPVGLQYGSNSGNIQVQEYSKLQVNNGQTLALVGGNIQINHSLLKASDGRIELGGLAGEGIVGLNFDNNNLRLSFPNKVPLADLSLNSTSVNVSGNGGGNIQVHGNRIILTNRSGFNADTLGSQNGSAIVLNASQLILRDGSYVSAGTNDTGQGGNVTINASDLVEVSGTTVDGQKNSGIGTRTIGPGAAGNINITTGKLIVQGGAVVSAGTEGTGAGGNLTVIASESVELIGTTADAQYPSGLFVRTKSDGVGGILTIITGRLIVRDGATASTSTSAVGKAGDLIIRASEAVEVRGTSANGQPSKLSTQVEPTDTATGDGGNLTIQTGRLIVEGGAQVSAATLGKGQGGTLRINASDFVEIIGTSATGIPSRLTTQTQGPKPAGDLIIDTRQLIVRNGANVEAGTFGEGQGGKLIINASESVKVIGSSANDKTGLSVESSGVGAAGDLRITTGELIVQNGAQVSVSSDKTAKAGDITVTAKFIQLDNQGELIAETASGQGGNINLKVQDVLLMRHGSRISTTAGIAKAGGDGGNIGIDSLFIVAVPKENSDITANAYTGKGGNVNITTQGIYGLESRPRLTPFSDITASSESGPNGIVQIKTSGIDPSRGLNNLPVEPVTTEVAEECQGQEKPGSVAFFNTGKGGLAPNPYEPLSSGNIWEDVSISTSGTANSTNPPQTIVEAQSWIVNAKGEVVLVAQMPITRSQSRCRLR